LNTHENPGALVLKNQEVNILHFIVLHFYLELKIITFIDILVSIDD